MRHRVQALPVRLLRGHPTVIVDGCSVRAERGGDLAGPHPTDRGRRGTEYHPAANVGDTVVFMVRGRDSGTGRSDAAMPGWRKTNTSRCTTAKSTSSSIPCSRPRAYSWLRDGRHAKCENRPSRNANYIFTMITIKISHIEQIVSLPVPSLPYPLPTGRSIFRTEV